MRTFCSVLVLIFGILRAAAQDQLIYTDALQAGWENWSWAPVNLSATSPVHSGTKSISVGASGTYQALYLHQGAFDSSPYTAVSFWINGGSPGGQSLQVQATLSGVAKTAVHITAPNNTWQQITIPLSNLAVANKPDLDGFWIQDASGTIQPTYYVDDIRLVASTVPPAIPTLLIDAAANRHPIDPRVYGMCWATQSQLTDLNIPLNRSGGNTESRYNWQLNAHNRGMDWYFESLADPSATPGAEIDSFISATKAAAAQPMVTVPLLEWVAKLGPSRSGLASFSIAKYGLQSGNDWQWFPNAGNGIKTNSTTYITNNDPNDANVQVTSAFQMDWVRHLTNQWKLSATTGIRYYILDNEPSLWHSTHRDVHPTGETMTELRDKYFDFAPKIKDLDPGALIVGPEEWGWSGYFYSGYDQQAGAANGYSSFPDRAANGNKDYVPWFLDQMRQQSATVGRRLLDIFTLHYYPQSGEYSDDVSTTMQARRNRSTRSLWDTNYTDASWINDKVKLIPRMREWVAANYPGTQIGLTEYSWGADTNINGATAQADILGILGREGIDLATRWTTPPTASPTYNAIKLYRNYDGNKSTFGETSISATAPNPDNIAIFAAQRTNDNALTLIAINKQIGVNAPAILTITNFTATTAQRFQLTSANTITKLPDITFTNNIFSNTLPAQSITLYILGVPTNPPPKIISIVPTATQLTLTLQATVGKTYTLESTSNLVTPTWTPVQTNTAPAATFDITLPRPTTTELYRATQLN